MLALRSALLLPATAIVVAGAGCGPAMSTAAPPLVVCGTTLWSGDAGAVMTDATGPDTTVTFQTAGNLVVLKLVDGCQHGATYSIDPPAAAAVAVRAATSDGRTAAIALIPRVASFDVHIARGDAPASLVTVRLGSNFVPTATSDPAPASGAAPVTRTATGHGP